MSDTTVNKQSLATRAKNKLVQNEKKILVTIAVASTVTSVVMGKTLHKHNEFLKERGLLDEFYGTVTETV